MVNRDLSRKEAEEELKRINADPSPEAVTSLQDEQKTDPVVYYREVEPEPLPPQGEDILHFSSLPLDECKTGKRKGLSRGWRPTPRK